MKPSPNRVANQHRMKTAGLDRLSPAQKAFVKDVHAVAVRTLKRDFEGARASGNADIRTQDTNKVYRRDAYGRNSALAGIPHAKVRLNVSALQKDGELLQSWEYRPYDTVEFLLSEDGTTAVMKEDSHWGRSTKVLSARDIGKKWGEMTSSSALKALYRRLRTKEQEAEVEAARLEAERQKTEAEAARLRAEDEKRRREEALSGGGRGYTVRTTTQWENDELDADDDWDNPDPEEGFNENKDTYKTMRDVWRSVSKGSPKLSRDKLVMTRDYDRRYKARGIYNLTRSYYEETTVQRADGNPFTEVENAYIKENFF